MRPRPVLLTSSSQRVDVVGRLLVGVRGDEGVEDGAAAGPREGDLETELVGTVVLADATDRGRGLLARPEGPGAGMGERAVLVVADDAAAGSEDGRPDGLEVVDRHEAHELEPVDRRGRDGGDALETHDGRPDVGEPAGALVEIGVTGDHDPVLARGTQHGGTGRRLVGEHLGRGEERRVMHQEEVGRDTCRLVEHGLAEIESDEDVADLPLAAADLETDAVPRLRQLEGCQPVDLGKQGTDSHGSSVPP